MQSKYIIVPMLLSVLVFGGTNSAFAETSPVVNRESIFDRIKDILTSVQHFFDHSLAQVMGTYATTGATAQLPVVTADFGVVEYYPNLKTKIGFSANAKDPVLSKAVEGDDNKLEKIGPGMICSNIEFDLAYKHPGESNAAVDELVDSAGKHTTLPEPSAWFKAYETRIGDLNVPQLYQLTGTASQNQLPVFINTGKNISIHPAPTDPIGNANFMAAWTAATNHSYPTLWSFWN